MPTLQNWFAYKDLPESLLSQQHKLAFPNNYKPLLQDHNAFCQVSISSFKPLTKYLNVEYLSENVLTNFLAIVSLFQTLQFPETFLSAPTIIVSAAHTKTSLTMPPEYNSIVTWVEVIISPTYDLHRKLSKIVRRVSANNLRTMNQKRTWDL